MPILRKSPPSLTVCVPKNREYDAFALVDFQLISVGLIAPSTRATWLGSELSILTWGNFGMVIRLVNAWLNPSDFGSKSMLSVLLSGKRVSPKRSAITDASPITQVLLSASTCGRRFRR